MKFDVKFSESNQSINAEFKEIQKADDGGYEAGYEEGYDVGYAEGEEAGYEKGKAEGINASPANYASKTQFASDDWAESDNVVLYMPNLSDMSHIFAYVTFSKIKTLTIKSDTPITKMQACFQGNSGESWDTLERLILYVDTSQCTMWSNTFMTRFNLLSIEGNPLDFSSSSTIGSGLFSFSGRLISFRVVPNTIKSSIVFRYQGKLDNETIQSIIDGLADLTGGTAQTLTVHADVKAKIVANPVWLAAIVGKNWTLA